MHLKIAQLGQPILRQVAQEIPADRLHMAEFRQFIADMRETLQAAGGVGLAAPQVFRSLRVFLAKLYAPPREGEPAPIEVLINPRLTPLTEEVLEAWEGCLSFQELLVLVPRYGAVRVDYLDAEGQPRALALQGFPARIVQHEYDHLEGILTIDRAESTHDIVKASEIDAVLGKPDEQTAPPVE
jgi:peptide deformylase